MSAECLFCREVDSQPANVFYQDESGLFIARWDNFPSTPGHAEVVPRRHVAEFGDLNMSELSALSVVVARVSEIIKHTDLVKVYEVMGDSPVNNFASQLIQSALTNLQSYNRQPDAFNHGVNDGAAAGRTVDHMHYHIMPRWNGDVDDPRGGIRHMFDVGGNYQVDTK